MIHEAESVHSDVVVVVYSLTNRYVRSSAHVTSLRINWRNLRGPNKPQVALPGMW